MQKHSGVVEKEDEDIFFLMNMMKARERMRREKRIKQKLYQR